MKSRIIAAILFVSLALFSFGLANVATAQTVCTGANHETNCDPLKGACYGSAAASSVCNPNKEDNPISGSQGIILRASAILSYVVGVVCIIIIIIAGIRYAMSQGDSSSVSSAKNQILYALIGLAVVVAARTIIVYVINKL